MCTLTRLAVCQYRAVPGLDQRPIPSTSEAVAATVGCAKLLGLPSADPEVIATGYSVRVRLRPAAVISRVLTEGQILRGAPRPWLQREVDVAGHLAGKGAPVTAPWDQPGPFLVNGLDVSLWAWVDHQHGVTSSRDFGGLLRELHAELDTFTGELPLLVGPLTDVRAALAISDDATLHAAARTLLPLALTWPQRPLHGDAHTGNVLITGTGPRWTDFEDTCLGPLEWDLASATLSDEAIDGYGRDAVDLDRLRDCRDLRRLQILAGILTDDVQNTSRLTEITDALGRY